MDESKSPPKLFPPDFNISAGIILRRAIGITVCDITHENCRSVYLRLVKLINALVYRGIPVCSAFTPSDTDSDLDTNSDTDSSTN